MSENITVVPHYELIVKSWENDGDNYNSKSIYSTDLNQIKFYYELVKMFKSKNWDGLFGNGSISYYEECFCEKAKDLALQYNVSFDLGEYPKDSHEEVMIDMFNEIIYDLIGVWNEGEMYRVFDSAKLYYHEVMPKNLIDQNGNITV